MVRARQLVEITAPRAGARPAPALRSQRGMHLATTLLALAAILTAETSSAPDSAHADSCAARATSIEVRTADRTLILCQDGAPVARFAVALGVGGVGKRRRGDNKTPLGTYALGSPRRSQDFGTFIPVGYPTAAQARAGFTGSAVGIHGPARPFVHAGRLNTMTDWTAGCIAVGSDEEIERVAAWLRQRPRTAVHIE
jgi:murein L,D-transpeptidase YafK